MRTIVSLGLFSLLVGCSVYRSNGTSCEHHWTMLVGSADFGVKETCEAESADIVAAKQAAAAQAAKEWQEKRDQDKADRESRRLAEEKAEQDAEAARRASIADYCKKKTCAKFETAALDKKLAIGMPRELVILSWGEPKSVNRTVTAKGQREQLVYGVGTYVYIEAGVVRAVQD